jgi:hypothetical protein
MVRWMQRRRRKMRSYLVFGWCIHVFEGLADLSTRLHIEVLRKLSNDPRSLSGSVIPLLFV